MIAVITILTIVFLVLFVCFFKSFSKQQIKPQELSEAIDSIMIVRGITNEADKDITRAILRAAYRFEGATTYEELDAVAKKALNKMEVKKWQNAINAKKKEI